MNTASWDTIDEGEKEQERTLVKEGEKFWRFDEKFMYRNQRQELLQSPVFSIDSGTVIAISFIQPSGMLKIYYIIGISANFLTKNITVGFAGSAKAVCALRSNQKRHFCMCCGRLRCGSISLLDCVAIWFGSRPCFDPRKDTTTASAISCAACFTVYHDHTISNS